MAITAGIQNGTDILVYIDGVAVVHGTTSSFDPGHDVRETSSKDSPWRTVREGRLSWTGSADVLFAQDASFGFNDLFTTFKNRTRVQVKFSSNTVGDTFWFGDAYIASMPHEQPDQDNATFSMDFEGDGELFDLILT